MKRKRKQKPPLHHATQLIYDAIAIAYQYKWDETYQPTARDLALFRQFDRALWECHCSASYISHAMHQRFLGMPEGARKYSDPVVFDE